VDAAWPGSGYAPQRQRPNHYQRYRAAGRDPALLHRPTSYDPGPRPLLDDLLALRGCAGPPGRRRDRPAEEGGRDGPLAPRALLSRLPAHDAKSLQEALQLPGGFLCASPFLTTLGADTSPPPAMIASPTRVTAGRRSPPSS